MKGATTSSAYPRYNTLLGFTRITFFLFWTEPVALTELSDPIQPRVTFARHLHGLHM